MKKCVQLFSANFRAFGSNFDQKFYIELQTTWTNFRCIILLHQRLLKNTLDDEVRSQDMIQIITTVASNPDGRQPAWTFFNKNFKKIVKR